MDGFTVRRSPLPDDLAIVGQRIDVDRTLYSRAFGGRADRVTRAAWGCRHPVAGHHVYFAFDPGRLSRHSARTDGQSREDN